MPLASATAWLDLKIFQHAQHLMAWEGLVSRMAIPEFEKAGYEYG